METTNTTTTTQEAINLNSPIPADLELYTIPCTSEWFDWNGIHEIERVALKEFFDSSSYTRTPKVYREYRDWIINKFGEEPRRRLRFTEVRKALVGDVSLLKKVFVCLEKWGLINFGVEDEENEVGFGVRDGKEKLEVGVEEGAPVGVRVVSVPGKGVTEPVSVGSGGCGGGEFKFPPLVSYSDVFGGLVKREVVVVCGSCGDKCGSWNYESKKGKEVICKKCFDASSFGEGNTIEDFEFDESKEVVWTDEETLLLLQSVVKHGNDWELISQTVKTKSKLGCIAKMITLPLGDFVLGSDHGLIVPGISSECSVKDVQTPLSKQDDTVKTENIMADEGTRPMQSSKPVETIKSENITSEAIKPMQNGDTDYDGPPLKKKCIDRSYIMKQLAFIASMVSPHITGAAAEAAVAAFCNENPDIKEVFDIEEYSISDSGATTASALDAEDSEMMDTQISSKTSDTFQESSVIPLALRYRAATATALGAAAARAKILADQEDKELEYLMATIIDNQLKKLQCKMKVIDHVQQTMETECAFIADQEESIISEHIDVLKRALDLGITRLLDIPSVQSQINVVL